VEALNLSRNRETISLNEIAEKAGTTITFARKTLGDSIRGEDANAALLDSSTRFKLAIEATRLGGLRSVARALTWQEFEAFSEECLHAFGFCTRRGVIVKDDARRWQIDVIAKKSRMILAVDCKHWGSPGYASKVIKAVEHQRLAVCALLQQMTKAGEVDREGVLALPIILTLLEPRSRLTAGAVLLSVEQFADFLGGVSPYSSELPFILSQDSAKSSMS
jgi:hypothetical protein